MLSILEKATGRVSLKIYIILLIVIIITFSALVTFQVHRVLIFHLGLP